MNEEFNAEITQDFETALGPHPKYENGMWIKRIEELRFDKEKYHALVKQYDRAIKSLDPELKVIVANAIASAHQ